MTGGEALALVREWGTALGTVNPSGDGVDVALGDGTAMEVDWSEEERAVVLRREVRVRAPAEGTVQLGAVDGVVLSRPGLLAGEARSEGGDLVVALSHPVHADGLSRHTFLAAAAEIGKAARAVLPVLEVAATVAADAPPASPEPEPEPAPEPEPVPEPVLAEPAALAEPAGGSPPERSASPPAAQPAAASPAAGAWARTHVVGSGGAAAWAAPDPSRPSVANLQAGVELQVVNRLGDWAEVRASNGWAGWVDGRLLTPA